MTTSSGIPGAPGSTDPISAAPVKQPRRFRGLVVGGALAVAALVGVGTSVGGVGTTTITGTAVAASAAPTTIGPPTARNRRRETPDAPTLLIGRPLPVVALTCLDHTAARQPVRHLPS